MAHLGRKTHPPRLPDPVFFRETLVHMLEEALLPSSTQRPAQYKLILLCAPAGYGKTTLLADFARRSQRSAGWYFLERSDASLAVFLKTFMAIFYREFSAMEQALPPTFVQEIANALLSGVQEQYESLLDTYTTMLEQQLSHPFILCLCDYQNINKEKTIQIFLNHLLKKMPTNFSIVIESRAIPSLKLAPLLARRQLLGIGSDVLRFSAQEIREFSHMHQGNPLTEQEAEQLAILFDGWIAGILVATRLGNTYTPAPLDTKDGTLQGSALSIDQQTLLSYIQDDLFEKEPQALTFLQETSLLQNLTEQQCNTLLQINNAEAYLTFIEKQGLFLTRRSNQGSHSVYTLHPMLRRLFYEQLHRSQSERFILLQRRAADIALSLQDYEQARDHAMSLQDDLLLANIIIQAAQPGQEKPLEQATIASWIDALPAPMYTHHPHLLFIRANIHRNRQEYSQALPLLEKAYHLVTGSNSDYAAHPTLRAEITLAQSMIFLQKGMYLQAEQCCHEALEYLSTDETELRVLALICLSKCKTLLGQYTDALTQLHQALQLNGHHKITEQVGDIHYALANIYSATSNYAMVEHHRGRALAIYEQLNLMQRKIHSLVWIAIQKRQIGELDKAESMLLDIIALARQESFPVGEAYALFNLGANYLDKGLLQKALISLEDCLRLARQTENGRLIDLCLCELATVYMLMEDIPLAQVFLEQTAIAASSVKVGHEAIGYEIIRNTVLFFQKDYTNAARGFQAVESLAQQQQLKRAQIESLIPLAACQHALGLFTEVEASMRKVVQTVAQGYFEHVPLIILRRFPDLLQFIQKLPPQAFLVEWQISSQGNAEQSTMDLQKAEPSTDISPLEQPVIASLRILAFGEPTVMINDIPVTQWHMARAMELYFFLLDYGRPIRKEQLVEILWPGDEEYNDQTLRSAIHYLRRAIGKPCLSFQSGVYTLNQSAVYGDNIWYDVALFQEYSRHAEQALQNKQDDVAQEHLLALVQLYRGDYVQSFYSNWCTYRRDDLRKKYVNARRKLAQMTWQREQIEESMHHWQHLLAVDNCAEEAHYGLMHCYVRQGKRSLAVRQYQRCVDILKQELAIAPQATIQKFYQRLTNTIT